jgi:hypothetical protein
MVRPGVATEPKLGEAERRLAGVRDGIRNYLITAA